MYYRIDLVSYLYPQTVIFPPSDRFLQSYGERYALPKAWSGTKVGAKEHRDRRDVLISVGVGVSDILGWNGADACIGKVIDAAVAKVGATIDASKAVRVGKPIIDITRLVGFPSYARNVVGSTQPTWCAYATWSRDSTIATTAPTMQRSRAVSPRGSDTSSQRRR